MANKTADQPKDRRDVIHEGSSLSGSTKRDNDATAKAVHPRTEQTSNEERQPEQEVNPHSPEREEVNQNPGLRQKRNQGNSKDDPLAA